MQNSLKSDEEFTSAAKLPNKIVAELMDIAESSRQFTRLHPLRQAEIFQNLCKIATAHGVALTLSELAAYMGRKEKNLKEKVLPLLDTQFTAVHKTDKNRYYFE